MGQSKSKTNIKYERVSPVISDDDSEDEIDVEIGNLKKSDEESEIPKPKAVKPFSKAWCIGVGFATISGEAQFISKINILLTKYKN